MTSLRATSGKGLAGEQSAPGHAPSPAESIVLKVRQYAGALASIDVFLLAQVGDGRVLRAVSG